MSDVRTDSARGLLTLLSLKGVGPRSVDRLSETFSTLDAVRGASEEQLVACAGKRGSTILLDFDQWDRVVDRVERELEDLEHLGIEILSFADQDYPLHLKLIPDRPPVLYVKGSLPGRRTVACIGTREPSVFGQEVALRISRLLAREGWSIVSGLALGCDTLSHEGALEVGGHTVAILGNGLDKVYPARNRELAERILDSGGALVSELPLGIPAVPRNLVARDRLQSGMSVGTIVMQTGITGGSMHTVRFTLLQGRLLVAPLPRGRHAEHEKSAGIIALGTKTGRQLASILDGDRGLRELLVSRFGDRPPATPVRNREDYTALISALETRLEGLSVDSLHEPHPSLFAAP